jgi:phytoene synthase
MPVDHYENFPVASVLLPPHLREPVEAIYAFARTADDIADEGEATADERLAQLQAFRDALSAIGHGKPVADPALAPLFARLERALGQHALPPGPLFDLLDAFSQDVVKTRYADFSELRDYCRRSADPVGRLMLHLYRAASPDLLHLSDCICTGLQLINFCQDVAIDWRKGRLYLPVRDLARFGLTEHELDAFSSGARTCDQRWRALLAFEIERARALMLEGAPLARRLPGRIGFELRLVVLGGLRTLERIEGVAYDIFNQRPTLGATDWIRLLWRALIWKPA